MPSALRPIKHLHSMQQMPCYLHLSAIFSSTRRQNLLAKSFGFDFSRRKIRPKIELAGKNTEAQHQKLIKLCPFFF